MFSIIYIFPDFLTYFILFRITKRDFWLVCERGDDKLIRYFIIFMNVNNVFLNFNLYFDWKIGIMKGISKNYPFSEARQNNKKNKEIFWK